MLDICLLGTGGMMPLPRRYLTSLIARYNGLSILIDCGEGTQIALRKKGWSANPIGIMLFTHYHADHISGLPGMLLNMANAERTEDVLMVGPKGLQRIVESLKVIAGELPVKIRYHELSEREEDILLEGGYIRAFKVNHNVTCYGYSINIERKGRFDAEAARSLGIPLEYWNKLQHGQTIEDGEKIYTPSMVMGPDRKGLKVTYATDTRPARSIIDNAKGADLLICEGMYGEDDKLPKAKEKKHMTFREAAMLAKEAGPSEMWLTHYGPAMGKPDPFMPMVQGIFPEAKAGKDGMSKEFVFEDEVVSG